MGGHSQSCLTFVRLVTTLLTVVVMFELHLNILIDQRNIILILNTDEVNVFYPRFFGDDIGVSFFISFIVGLFFTLIGHEKKMNLSFIRTSVRLIFSSFILIYISNLKS